MSSNPSLVVNNFPNIPMGAVVDKNGMLTGPWIQFFTQVSMFMNKNFNSEGIKLPPQPADYLTGSGALNNINSNGNLVYNNTANTAMVNLNGVYKTIQTS